MATLRRATAAVVLSIALAACSGSDSGPAMSSGPAVSDGPTEAASPTINSDADSSEAPTDTAQVARLEDDVDVCWAAEPPDGEGIRFDDVTSDNGLVEPLTGMYGHATASADVNGDSWTDLFVAGFADRDAEEYQVRGADGPAPDRLLLGGADGFTIDGSFEGELARTSGATFADLDNDADLDLIVIRTPRGDDEIGTRASAVYEQTDDGWNLATTFGEDVAGRSVAAVDIDRDGWLDLAVAGDRFGPGPSRLYRNDGNLTFSDATGEWGMPDDMDALALVTVDLDADGWLDIVASGDERVLLGGPEGFEVVVQPTLEWELHGEEDDPAGIAIGDLDGDGRPDLVVGQHFNSTIDDGQSVPVRVFLNRTDGGELELVDVTADVGVPGLWTKSPHVVIADVDNDGHPDIVTSAATDEGVPFVLHNTGADTLAFEAVGEPGDGTYWVTGATEDFDHDGRLDAFMMAWEPGVESPLFRNVGAAGHWVEIDVSALGPPGPETVVRADVGDVEHVGWAQSTTGYAAGTTPTVRFGLGDVDGAVAVVVEAPGVERREFDVEIDGRSAVERC